MRAAVYARKSTEQTGVAAEARSVTRQIENARAYAESSSLLKNSVYA
jgi:DNA invertase Pin-like site-specific DNA recombinase